MLPIIHRYRIDGVIYKIIDNYYSCNRDYIASQLFYLYDFYFHKTLFNIYQVKYKLIFLVLYPSFRFYQVLNSTQIHTRIEVPLK